jgi:hypothetical protein
MSATGLTARLMLGAPASDPAVKGGFRLIMGALPNWPVDGEPEQEGNPPDVYYWYFGTLALRRKGGDAWRDWRKALRAALLTHQETREDLKGSWPPAGRWDKIGGRVMSTALATLCLELADDHPSAFK